MSINKWVFKMIDLISTPYAYEVTDNRGHKYLVFAGSVAYNNAVMFKYKLKPLYEANNGNSK